MQIRLQKKKGSQLKRHGNTKGKTRERKKETYIQNGQRHETKKENFFLAQIFFIITFTQYRAQE